MLILGIETSCDETAASVACDGREILSNVVASSAEMHQKTGGIIPEQAAREQVRSIIPVVEEALVKAFEAGNGKWDVGSELGSGKIEAGENTHLSPHTSKPTSHCSHHISNIDAIAVTVGPGLIGSLLVGVETAKTLAYTWDKPIVPVNHLMAHIYANWLTPKNLQQTTPREAGRAHNKQPKLPAVALVVSGGHTDLVLIKDHGKLQWIGGTRDDAAGEAFDKTARLLGLPYPGGPAIAETAAEYRIENSELRIKLPRPMLGEDNFDFSFSGLKTAVVREVEHLKTIKQYNNITISHLAYEIQEAITDVLVEKTLRAVKKHKTETLLLAGGVAANRRLRKKFEEAIKLSSNRAIKLHVPPPELCTDNASYIAAYAEYNYKPIPWQKISANPSLTIKDQV